MLALLAEMLSEVGRVAEALAITGDLFARYPTAPEDQLPYVAACGLRAKVGLLLNMDG